MAQQSGLPQQNGGSPASLTGCLPLTVWLTPTKQLSSLAYPNKTGCLQQAIEAHQDQVGLAYPNKTGCLQLLGFARAIRRRLAYPNKTGCLQLHISQVADNPCLAYPNKTGCLQQSK